MRYLKYIICLFVILFVCSTGFAADQTYIVTETGAGADFSAADFNNASNWSATEDISKIDPGDTVYFSGTISTRLYPKKDGTSGHPIILDGYQAGDFDPWGGSTANALLTGGIAINSGYNYITIQDFRMSGGPTNGNQILQIYNSIVPSDASDHITVQRNYLYDAHYGLFGALETHVGASYYSIGPNYLTLESNRMVGYGQGYDATQGLNFVYTNDLVVRNNELAGGVSSNCTSDNVIEIHATDRAIFEYNDIHNAYKQAGLAIKEAAPYNHNIILRFNKVHDNGTLADEARGLYIGCEDGVPSNIYIYGNYVYNNGAFGIDPNRGIEYVWIWSNLIINNQRNGIILWNSGGLGPENHIYVYNNTIAHNETDTTDSSNVDRTGFAIRDDSSYIYTKNNIFYYNRPNATSYQQWASLSSSSNIFSDYNTFYYPSQTPTWYFDSAIRSWDTMKNTYSLEQNSEIEDPGFNGANNGAGADSTYGTTDDDYSLDGTNADGGVDLSQQFQIDVQGTTYTMNLDTALDPNNTDWTQVAPDMEGNIATVNRNTYKVNGQWTRGAYAYFSEPTSPAPVITYTVEDWVSDNSYTYSCPYGQDPQTVNYWLWTDIASYCKGGFKTTTCVADYPSGYSDAGLTAYDGGGTTTHGLLLSTACDQTATVCAICSTTSGSGGSESGWTEINITLPAEEGEPGTPGNPIGTTIHSDTSGHATVTLHSDTSGHALTTPY